MLITYFPNQVVFTVTRMFESEVILLVSTCGAGLT